MRAPECLGHPAGPFDPMGETVYCDGTCRGRRPPSRTGRPTRPARVGREAFTWARWDGTGVAIQAWSGPGDAGEHVVTLMLEGES